MSEVKQIPQVKIQLMHGKIYKLVAEKGFVVNAGDAGEPLQLEIVEVLGSPCVVGPCGSYDCCCKKTPAFAGISLNVKREDNVPFTPVVAIVDERKSC